MQKNKGETSCANTNESSSPGSGSTAASPAPHRRMQRVEILKIAEGTPLIDPAEVVVSQGAVLTAEPVLTPLGIHNYQLHYVVPMSLVRICFFLGAAQDATNVDEYSTSHRMAYTIKCSSGILALFLIEILDRGVVSRFTKLNTGSWGS